MTHRLWTPTFIGLVIANFCNSMLFYLLVPTMAGYAADRYGAGPAVGGALASVFFIGALAARLFSGALVARHGPRKVALVAAGGCLLTAGGYLLAPDLVSTFVVRAANGFGFGLLGSALASAVMMIIPIRRRSEGAGWFGAGLAIAIGLGPFLGIWLARTSSMTAVFWVAVAFAALALAILLALSRGLPGPDAEHASARHGWRTLLERRVLGLATVIFGCGIVNSAVITFLDPATRGTELAQAASWFFLVYAGVVLVWRPVGGVLQDRVGERPVLAPCLAALAVALGLLASAQSPAMIIAAAVAFGLGWGTITSGGQAAAVNRAPAARTGAAIGTFFFALDLGTGIGPILLGLLVDPLGYRWVFGLAALAAVLTVPLYLRDAARNVGPAS